MREVTKLRIFAVVILVSFVLGSWLTYDENDKHNRSVLHSKYWH